MIDPIAEVSGYDPVGSRVAPNEMGKEEFLQLLVAQLRNQDPLDPLKDADFIAQMSQFSSLEQLINMNSNLTDSINLDYLTSQSIANSMATSLLGKTITADTDLVYLQGGGEVEINYNLTGAAREVQVMIYNDEGSLVEVLYEDYVDAGMNSINWDGKSSEGGEMPAGNYRVEVKAQAADGSPIEAHPFLVGKVDKVQYLDGAAYLLIDGATVMLGDIVEVKS